MTEAEWRRSNQPWRMVECITTGSPRKYRLFATACLAMLNERYPTDSAILAVTAIEDYAEGRISEDVLRETRDQFWIEGVLPEFRDHGPDPRDAVIWESMGPDAKFAALVASLDVSAILGTHFEEISAEYRFDYPPGHGHPDNDGQSMSCSYSRLPIGPVSAELAGVLRDIIRYPSDNIRFDPCWRTSTVLSLASAIYADRTFDRLPILADALGDAGCDLLAHCRSDGSHVRGCWAVDLILGKS